MCIVLQKTKFLSITGINIKYVTFINVYMHSVQFSSSVVSDSATPCTAACQACLSITNSRSPLKLMSIKSVMPSIRVFSMSQLFASSGQSIEVSASTSVLPPGLIFRMDWLILLVVQGTLKSLLQHQSSKASILQQSAFFLVQLSHPYMTTGKTIALTRWTFLMK